MSDLELTCVIDAEYLVPLDEDEHAPVTPLRCPLCGRYYHLVWAYGILIGGWRVA